MARLNARGSTRASPSLDHGILKGRCLSKDKRERPRMERGIPIKARAKAARSQKFCQAAPACVKHAREWLEGWSPP